LTSVQPPTLVTVSRSVGASGAGARGVSNAGVPRIEGERIRSEKEGKELCRDAREGGGRGSTAIDCRGFLAAGTWMSFVAASAMGGLEEAVDWVVVLGPCSVLISHVLSWLESLYALESLVLGVPDWFRSSATAVAATVAAALSPGVSSGNVGVVELKKNKNE